MAMGNHPHKPTQEDYGSSHDQRSSPIIPTNTIPIGDDSCHDHKQHHGLDDQQIKKIGDKGNRIDPGLLILLEFFSELHSQKRELFEKIFPKLGEEHVEMIKSHGVKSCKGGQRSVQRSRSVNGGEELKLDRFKVKTVDVGGDVQAGKTK